MFSISHTPLDADALKLSLSNPQAGALVTFEGWVRNHNEGQAVSSLEYEAFEAMAQSEADVILAQAKAQFDILDVACVHRVGHLAIGEMAVWVGVASAHRKAAFDACEYVIDEIKHRLPIWKKEHYVSGQSEWVNCQQCASAHTHHHSEHAAPISSSQEVFAAQMALPEVGAEGQQKLQQAKVLVVGAGGLGSAVLPMLAAAGVGTLGVCDGDTVSAGNLNRQTLYGPEDIGHAKVTEAIHKLRHQFPYTQFEAYSDWLTEDNVLDLLAPYDLILDCTDTMATRLTLSDAAVELKKPMLQASVYQYEGQIFAYSGQAKAPCLRCLWPEAPDAVACSAHGTMGPVVAMVGQVQAWEALRALLGIPSPLEQTPLLLIDATDYHLTPLAVPQNPACPLHPHQNVAQSSTPKVQNKPILTVTPAVLAGRSDWQVISLTDAVPSLPEGLACTSIPYEAFTLSHPLVSTAPNIALYCPHGIQSRLLARRYTESESFRCFVLESV